LFSEEQPIMSNDHLSQLLEIAKKIEMTSQEQEQQRRSFAYGNTKIENQDITREAIERAASVLAADDSR
jgi:hypothetical protein